MSIERIYHCDGPDCERHVRTQRTSPPTFITTHEDDGFGGSTAHHFCGWDCILRFASHTEPEQILEP